MKKRIIILIIVLVALLAIGGGVYLTFRPKANEYNFKSKKEKIVIDALVADNIEFKETDDKLQYVLTFTLINNSDEKLIAKDYQFNIVDKKGNVLTTISGQSFNDLDKNEVSYYGFIVSSNAHKLIIEKIK